MTQFVTTNLRDISKGAPWRGSFDGQHKAGHLHGWAILAANPQASLALDMYIDDVCLATTHTGENRSDIDDILKLATPAQAGFVFDLNTFRPEGALMLLRKYGFALPNVSVKKNIRTCIAGTQHPLPVPRGETFLDLAAFLPRLIAAAAEQLRSVIAAHPGTYQISPDDHKILLRANPLFSQTWYTQTYGEVAFSDLDPITHYARLGSVLDHAPGPWFDTQEYLAVLNDRQDSDLPLDVHYDVHGHDTWWPGQDRLGRQTPADPANDDYAVLIHLDDLAMVPSLQRFITRFPQDVAIFVSVLEDTPDCDPETVSMLLPRVRDVVTVPRPGNDVSAFLQTVRQVKPNGYTFFCKVYFGTSNTYPKAWRQVMSDALAVTPARVTQMVDVFRSNPKMLMAGPSQFWLNGPDFSDECRPRLGEFTDRIGLGEGALIQNWAFFANPCFWIDAGLAAQVAAVITADDFADIDVTENDQTTQAVGHVFSLLAMAVGGDITLLDGCDRSAVPVMAQGDDLMGQRVGPHKTTARFRDQHLRRLAVPQTIAGTAQKPRVADPRDVLGDIDTALHGAIDVLVSCWNGRPEALHQGLVDLGRQFEHQGLSWGALVTTRNVWNVFHTASCQNVVIDSLHLRFPPSYTAPKDLDTQTGLTDENALFLLRSGQNFLKTALPEGDKLKAALFDIRRLYAYWRDILIRHEVKVFLIWGNTAPKSRLFIKLCNDLNIEYQIIERGHFPGTLSIDPKGQFGTGVHTQVVTNVNAKNVLSENVEARFSEICSWYDDQQDHTAYADFHQRGTRDLNIMHRAQSHGRPVILVIGGNDQGSGVIGPEADPLRVTWFGTSDKAFTLIRRLVASKFPDALLVLRPHPSQAPQDGEFVLVAKQTALDDLIDASDLCITVATTTSAMCLLKGKPLLTLGLSELNGQDIGTSITDETHLLAAIRAHIWSDFADPYPGGANQKFIVDLFDHHLIGIDDSIPTRFHMGDLARLLAGRVQRMKTGFVKDYDGREELISQMMFADVRDRGRAVFRVAEDVFDTTARPRISVVLPIYGDYEGTQVCFDQLVRHQQDNEYQIITVWDQGPDVRLRDLCRDYAQKAGFINLENRENLGFSGTVNAGILHAGRDDVILLNSDTIPCDDWARRLQNAAYAHPKIASVVPFSNNASIFNIPFPHGQELPVENPVEWIKSFDRKAQGEKPYVVEMPVSHGFCTFFKRVTFDRLGVFSETKFDKGYGEDNEFSMRIRAAGYFCGCATHVFVGHAGSTSFAQNATEHRIAGRGVLQKEFSHYAMEVRDFVQNDPLSEFRKNIIT